ncbi:copper-transporting ATPase PAA1, chloroplastic-like isoform X2 [Primulina tabacum]|uniref:copper-transporting ATPase PAA1, chloroplastic-like isoform X2 n=1 Tax=Primulina tabacum TaxID=48773 RepID=UPI003F59A9FF
MDATLLSTNPNLFDSNSVAKLHRRFFTIRPSQITHLQLWCNSELSRMGSGYSARCFGSVDRLSSRYQFSAKGGYWKLNAVPAGASDAAALRPDAIVLHVRGMLCEGCVASVQRILESQETVSSANVNLTTETAIVWLVSDAKVAPGWQKDLGQALAKHLTSCGFESNLRDAQS